MKANEAEKQALIGLLNTIYSEICEIESAHRLLARAGDFRPRIEYFHDAIRALTAADPRAQEKGGRLSVEFLAYDVGMLRHIQHTPLASMDNAPQAAASVRRDVALPGQLAAMPPPRPDRDTRTRISELYKNYTVIFTALLAGVADRNYYGRVEDLNGTVEDLARLEQMLKLLAQGKVQAAQIESLAHQIEQDALREKILALLHQHSRKRLDAREIEEALRKIKAAMQAVDKDILSLETAHFSYVTAQLAAYEASKDVVKKMAQQGLNMAGKFLESALRDTASRGKGR